MQLKNILHNGRILLAAALLLGFFVNLNTLQNDFGWDDDEIVPNMSRVENWGQIFFPGSAGEVSGKAMVYYRPIVRASYYLDYRIWGERPFGFHLSVLFFHLLNTALVFYLARALVRGRDGFQKDGDRVKAGKGSVFNEAGLPEGGDLSLWVGFLAAVLFSIHPIHAEAVAWIAGRNDVLCTTFMLGAFLFYIRFRQGRGKPWLGLSLALFFFALITKETAVFLPGVFLLYEGVMWTRGHGSLVRELVLRLTPLVLVEGIYFGIRAAWSHSLASPPGGSFEALSVSMAGKGLTALGLYFKMLVFPYPHQPFIESLQPSGFFILFGLLVLVLMAAEMVRAALQKSVIVFVGLGWTLFLMVPGVLVSVIPVAVTDAAERYLYSSSVGWVMVLSFIAVKGGVRLAGSRGAIRTPRGAAVPVLVFLLVAIGSLERWDRNAAWRNQVTFWEAATRLNPESGLPFLELGTEYAKTGQHRKAEEWLIRAASNIEKNRGSHSPGLAKTLNNLGELYRIQKRYSEAEEMHQRALLVRRRVLGPGHADIGKTAYALGLTLQAQGRLGEAEKFYRQAIGVWESSSAPAGRELTQALNNLAGVVGGQGRNEEAAEIFERAVNILVKQFGPMDPGLLIALENYALALRRSGREAEASEVENQIRMIRGL